jgi:REP element-mobilizing transposase RayT
LRWRRKSLRLPKHNYAWTAAYFVTTCAEGREPLFDNPELRAILEDAWLARPERFPGITLDEFVIMPDHIHCIVWLDDRVENAPTLGDVMKAYKSLTSVAWLRHIKTTGLECSGKIWQSRYFDRVIRDSQELEQIRQYIRGNPSKLGRPNANKMEDG